MTYTLVALDAERRQLQLAIASYWPGVGGVVPYFRAHVGLVCTQHDADSRLARRILDRLEDGLAPETATRTALADFRPDWRQVIAFSLSGDAFLWTGRDVDWHTGEARSPSAVCAGNKLADGRVVEATLEAYLDAAALLPGDRLVAALRAGEAAGGDKRGREAAAIRIWPLDGTDDAPHPFDLRADEDPDPIGVLERALARRRALGETVA